MPRAHPAKLLASAAAVTLSLAAAPVWAVVSTPPTALTFTGQIANAGQSHAVTPTTVFDFWSVTLDPFDAFAVNPSEAFVATVSLDGANTLPTATGTRFIRLFLQGPDLESANPVGTQGDVELFLGSSLVAGFYGQGCGTSSAVAACASVTEPNATALTFDRVVFSFTVDTLDHARTASTAVFDTVVTTPVPEAQTWALLTAGLALLGALGHRRRGQADRR